MNGLTDGFYSRVGDRDAACQFPAVNADPRNIAIAMDHVLSGEALRPCVWCGSGDRKTADAATQRDDVFRIKRHSEVLVVFFDEHPDVVGRDGKPILHAWRESLGWSPKRNGSPGNERIAILILLFKDKRRGVRWIATKADEHPFAQEVPVGSFDDRIDH